ncbi:hypothetical protein HERIO_2200 [Hepatospora eriocheir]|uniref:Uncharacterized protein n=1 Tax=Hepatospora eriocheir TaxID=1081669 RepID=A0A1X0Q7T9_9MICR|nr:hypothetical protein HERIO_2200 [Hepatospora eriocheir]
MIIIFCIVIGLFSSNYCIRGIAIPITGSFLIYDLLFFICMLVLKYDCKKSNEKQVTKPERFVDSFINEFNKVIFKEFEYFDNITLLSIFLNKFDYKSEILY